MKLVDKLVFFGSVVLFTSLVVFFVWILSEYVQPAIVDLLCAELFRCVK